MSIKNKKDLFFVLVIILLLPLVSPYIYFSQLESIYNLGDMIEMRVEVNPEDAGPLKIVLTCDNNTLDIYKGAPTELIQLPLTTLWMNSITGDCYFIGYYNGETKKSDIFKISKKLEISLDTDSFHAKPGESIKIAGKVKRLNGEGVNGNIEIKISIGNTTFGEIHEKVADGGFSTDYPIKKDALAGNYRIEIIAYEETTSERTSEGFATANLEVLKVAKSIDIAIDTQEIEPGESISFKPVLNDQSNSPLEGEIAIEIRNNRTVLFQKIVNSGETIEFQIPTNTPSDYYEITASTSQLYKTKRFHVGEKELALFEMINDTLSVKNIGNIPYKKTIEVTLNGKTFFIKPENIMPGEKKEFKITSDKEKNSIKIDDKTTSLELENIQLPVSKKPNITGAYVGLKGILNTPIIWIIFLLILGAIILFLIRDVFKKKSVAYPLPEKKYRAIQQEKQKETIKTMDHMQRIPSFEKKEMEKEIEKKSDKYLSPTREKIETQKADQKTEIPFYSSPIKNLPKRDSPKELQKEIQPVKFIGDEKELMAEQTLVTDGQRTPAAVITIKIKNSINEFSRKNLEKALTHAYEKKGAVYKHADLISVLFSPLLTKSFKNEIEAIKTAEKVVEEIKEHNKKFIDKIEFGIGISSGEIINKIENKKLKFTSLGKLTISAKKLAELSKGEILISKEVYEKTMSEIKAEKRKIEETEFYELKKVSVDPEKNKKFINDFLKRESERDRINRNQ